MMGIVHFLVVLAALYAGARYGSLALGAVSGLGLAVLVFVFGFTPGTPPTDVIYIIIAAITCASCLQAAGGMDYLIQLAEKLLRKHPRHITFLAPLCTFFLTVLVGTGHVVYTLMPIIADIALQKGIRPERPCAVSAVASQAGVTCSPISAAVVAFCTISAANGFEVTIPQVLMVTMPSVLIGLLAASAVSYRKGKELEDDPGFQKKLSDPKMKEYIYQGVSSSLEKTVSVKSKMSVFVFLLALFAIVMMSVLHYNATSMNLVIQIVMLSAAAVMIVSCGAAPDKAVSGPVFKSGMVAVVSIFGIAWMSDTFFAAYMEPLKEMLGRFVARAPWAIAFVFFIVSTLISSQGAVIVAMMPLAFSLGIPGPVLLGVLPSVYGYFFIPNYPSVIATVNFDRSGTTRIGKYLFNHSFMIPGLVTVGVASAVGLCISLAIYH